MNCVTHKEVPAAAYCRTCGSALCGECTREVKGVVYCENCIAARLSDTLPPVGSATTVGFVAGVAGDRVVVPLNQGPSPGLALALGFIPGVGAMYNGQFMKAVMHVLIFSGLIYGADHGGPLEAFFGMGIAFWIFYMVFDAYKTAQARRMGVAPPDPFGFDRMMGVSAAPAAGVVPAAGVPAGAAAPVAPEYPRAPVGAIVLIALGVLFLLSTMGFWHWGWVGRFWPVILIVMGVWMFMRRPRARS